MRANPGARGAPGPGSLALLGVLMACFWKLVGPPHFPFVGMLAASIGCGLAVVGYDALLRFLSR
jgi:hypothetical protein